jgi:MFS transporter, DHA1 family, inner membrane transport protein
VNLRVFVLALGTFAIGTGTFVVTGLLGGVSEDLSVSVGVAGDLVSVFAVAYAISSPILVAATGRVQRRQLLVAVLVLFALANAAAALVPTFGLLLVARVVAACCAGICTPVATAVAAEISPPEQKGRAISVAMGGLPVSWALGVPLGAVMGDYFGWRASFVLVTILAAVAAAGVGTLLPAIQASPAEGGFFSRFTVARRAAVLVALSITALGVGGGFVVLTYVRPLLEALTDLGGEGIGAMLILFGVASVVGTALGGYGADRWGYGRSVMPILVILTLSLLSFSVLSAAEDGTVLVIFGAGTALVVWSVVGFSLIPLQQYRLIDVAPEEQNEVLSLNASAIYLGQGLGAGLGSLVVGYVSLASLGWVGASCAAVALIVMTTGAYSSRRGAGKDKKASG